MTLLTGLILILLATCTGRALLPSREVLARSLWEELGVAYLLGVALFTTVITAGFAAGLNLSLLWWVPLLMGIGGFLADRRRSASLGSLSAIPWSKPIGIVLAVVAGAAFCATLGLPLNEFDPIYHWGYRGQVLHATGTPLSEAITGMIHADGYGRLVTHPNYPFGIPILESWVAHLGGWDHRWVQLPLALWSACLPMAMALGLRCVSNQAASLGAILAAATPMLYAADFPVDGFGELQMAGLGGETTLGGGTDLAVMAMFGCACALLLRASFANDRRTALCAGLALGGTVMMKNEGLALAGVLLLAVFLAQVIPPRRFRTFLPFAGIAIVAILPWLGLRAQLPAIDENYSEQFTVENVMHYLGGGRELVEKAPDAVANRAKVDLDAAPARIGLVAASFLDEFLDWRSWGLLWLLALVGLPFTLKRLRDLDQRWLGMVVFGGVLLYFLILLVTPWNFPSLREKGIPERLLVHLVGPIVLLFAAATATPSGSGSGKAD